MDLTLIEEQRILKQTAREFLKRECPKDVVRHLVEADEGYSPELWRKMAELGWMGLILPEPYGGSGWTFLDLILLMEEMGYNLCPGPFLSTTVLGSLPVLSAGSEAQRGELLPRIARGDLILTMALIEPGARFDAASVNVTATPDGGEYVIHGTKLFVPDAHVADYLLCVAKTADGADPEGGITVFMVDTGIRGVQCTPLKSISLDKPCEVVFSDVRVKPQDILGGLNQGWPLVRDTLERAAVAQGAEMIGGAQAAMDMALAYAKERVQFGRPIGSFQAMQHYFADMWMDIHGSQHLVYQAAWKISRGMPASKEVAMAKARVGTICRKAANLAHRIFGAIGFTMEHDLHLYTRRAVGGDLAFGGSDFHLEGVAKSLGL